MFSGLTIRGRCLLAAAVASAVCAVVLDERDLLRVAVFLAALPLFASAVSARGGTGLTAHRELEPRRAEVGTAATVRLRLTSRSGTPLGEVRLTDGVPATLGGDASRALHSPTRRREALVEYQVRPELRGIHHIGPLRCRAADPFGLSSFDRELLPTTRFTVLPRVFELSGLPNGFGPGTGETGSGSARAGEGADDSTVREYRQGDDIRRVHWKTTARRDELMVRTEERPERGGTTVLLDQRATAHRGTGKHSSLEWAVSAAASICSHLHRNGRRPRLVGAGGTPVPEDGRAHLHLSGEVAENLLLEALAALQPSARRELTDGADPAEGQHLVAVLGRTTLAGANELASLRPAGARSLALLLNAERWNTDGHGGEQAAVARRLRDTGWTVVTVDGPATPVPRVWESLCEQSTRPDVLRAER
ncbi:DUF58 domain-containing protein [Actinopolyspora erythraea]|uniref:DUF58 domain-containing protein n=1 Tax=Actinopolyspora erythraea TaxID=414996 RepID=A0A099D8U9_9ACTN|nr:DUF58 domain-containing protein [Actinopolyspora erythraea]KGI81835.1 hypothetical protein IL38_08910 [Actinopolyspora erythraea]